MLRRGSGLLQAPLNEVSIYYCTYHTSIYFLTILQSYHMLTQLIYLLLSIHDTVTTKFWVSEENLPQVLLKSVTELPLLVYGRSGLLQKDINNPQKEDLWESLASPISSVYFDSANMDLYKERIKRSEGAKLFRIRWYGNKPKSEDKIFLELKTHHECWVDNKSGELILGLILHNFWCCTCDISTSVPCHLISTYLPTIMQ